MRIRTTGVVGVIVVLHFVIVGSVALMQGCGRTVAPVPVERVVTGELPPAEPRLTPPVFRPSAVVRSGDDAIVASDLKRYTVQKGDSLSKIASRHGIKVKEILELNALKNKNVIFVGQTLNLPAHAQARAVVPSVARSAVPAPAAQSTPGSGTYVVQAGDCLSKIAVRCGTTVRELKDSNGLQSDFIRVGQKLTVPDRSARGASAPAPAGARSVKPQPGMALDDTFDPDVADDGGTFVEPDEELFILHTVEIGEDIDEVASKFGVTVDRLLSANRMTSRKLKPGMDLKIPQGN